MFRHSMLATLICAGSAIAAEPQANSDQLKPNPEFKAIMDRLDQMEKTIKGLDAQQSLQVQVWADKFNRDITEIREWLIRLQKEINENKSVKHLPTETLKPVETGSATLLLVNEHPTMNMDVVVNGVTHTMMPMQSKSVIVPAGSVNFRVIQTDAIVRARMLLAGVTHQVTMR